jgi:hypothetical protein
VFRNDARAGIRVRWRIGGWKMRSLADETGERVAAIDGKAGSTSAFAVAFGIAWGASDRWWVRIVVAALAGLVVGGLGLLVRKLLR